LEKLNNNFKENEDSKLWSAFKKGDESAFEMLYNKYIKQLGHYGLRLNPNKILVEDAIHDVFIELWKRKEFLSEVDNIKYYLFRVVRNQLNRNMKEEIIEGNEDINYFLDYLSTLSSEQDIISEETESAKKESIKNAINNLSNRQREAIHLRFYQGLSLDEVALIMELPKQVVKNLLSKSYAILRIYLKDSIIIFTIFQNL
jgi:RNA polymerase sigma factor (sigma-70 family)